MGRANILYELKNIVGGCRSKHKLHLRYAGGGISVTLANAGSPSRTRTSDPLINSQLLYQLSYWGTNQQNQLI